MSKTLISPVLDIKHYSTREYSLFKTNGQAELAERGSQDLKSNAKNVMELAE